MLFKFYGLKAHKREETGMEYCGIDVHQKYSEICILAEDGEVSCVYDSLQLVPGEYLVDAAVHARDGLAYDYWCDALRIRVTSEVDWPGIWAAPLRWESSGPRWDD